MIVIDASSLAKYLLREEGWEAIEEYLIKSPYTVDHIFKEVANAIWKHTILYSRLSRETGLMLYSQLKRLIFEKILIVESQEKYVDKAVEISMQYRIPVYDSLYIAQALKLGELVTSDEKQARIAEKLGVKIHYVP